MIVQATNIGADVFSGQMDLMIPGGGVGLFNGCTRQWGHHDLDATYGGFLSKCQNEHGAVCANNGGRLRCVGVEFPDAQHEEVKKCVRKMCGDVFEGRRSCCSPATGIASGTRRRTTRISTTARSTARSSWWRGRGRVEARATVEI